jgi:hypothetical protein
MDQHREECSDKEKDKVSRVLRSNREKNEVTRRSLGDKGKNEAKYIRKTISQETRKIEKERENEKESEGVKEEARDRKMKRPKGVVYV